MEFTKTVLAAVSLIAPALGYGAILFDNGTLITDVAFNSRYTSNSQSSANGQEDWINTLTPTLRYESFGTEWQKKASLGISFLSYSTQDRQNENINFSASISHPRGLGLSGGVSETTDGDPEFGRVVRTRNYSFSTSVSYDISPLYPTSTGFSYSRSQPLDESTGLGRSETESFSIPFNINHRYSEVLSLGAGYRFGLQKSAASQNASDSTNHSIFANASGKVFPLVDANLSLGVQMRQDDEGNQFSPYASGGLIWRATDLTTVGMNLSAGFETTTGNRSSRRMSIGWTVGHNFATNLNGSLSAGLSMNEFSDVGGTGGAARSDTSWNVGAGLSTTVYEHTSLSLSVNYQSSSSDRATSEFDSYGIGFSASRPF